MFVNNELYYFYQIIRKSINKDKKILRDNLWNKIITNHKKKNYYKSNVNEVKEVSYPNPSPSFCPPSSPILFSLLCN